MLSKEKTFKIDDFNTIVQVCDLDGCFIKDEFIRYFGDNDAEYANRNANTIGTQYAYKRGLDVNSNEDMWCNGFSPYWLRTPGSYRTSTIYVSSNGGYVLWGDAVNVSYGVRPAIWVQLK